MEMPDCLPLISGLHSHNAEGGAHRRADAVRQFLRLGHHFEHDADLMSGERLRLLAPENAILAVVVKLDPIIRFRNFPVIFPRLVANIFLNLFQLPDQKRIPDPGDHEGPIRDAPSAFQLNEVFLRRKEPTAGYANDAFLLFLEAAVLQIERKAGAVQNKRMFLLIKVWAATLVGPHVRLGLSD